MEELKKKQSNLDGYMKNKAIARTEILWAFCTVQKNLSFNLSEYIGDLLPHMFSDSVIAKYFIINKKKVKKLIEDVLVGGISMRVVKYMKRNCCILVDYSRDVANKIISSLLHHILMIN